MDGKRVLDFFEFRTLVSRSWLPWVYDIGALLITAWAIFALLSVISIDRISFVALIVLLDVAVVHVAWRLFCEALVMLTRLHDTLVPLPVVPEEAGGESEPPAVIPVAQRPIATIPEEVGDDYDRWVDGDASALDPFIAGLAACLDDLPPRVDATFLATRFRTAAGTPAFDELLQRRARRLETEDRDA